ncbi:MULTISPECIES: hypothetical protein [unclassified Jeotgalibaca]|uniref:hypothetical protein n=1 Tax=unclassified Jeotgalibaca TaxID=2621505 RepID=UPI003FD12D14
MRKAMLKDNLMELDYQDEKDPHSYKIIANETQETVFEITTDNDEKFIRALMEQFKIKELELYYMCD